MRTVDVNSKITTFCIGHRGENEATQVRFDYVELFQNDFGPGVCELLVQRPGDSSPYLVPLTLDGDRVCWTVSDTDTDVEGRTGKAILHYYVGTTLAKTNIWMFGVLESLGGPTDTPPEKFHSWLEQMSQIGADTKAAARDARLSEESAKTSADAAATAKQESERTAKESADSAAAAEVSEKNAKDSEEAALNAAREAENTVNNAAWVAAEINESGHLILTQSDNFNGATFTLNNNGHLEVAYT